MERSDRRMEETRGRLRIFFSYAPLTGKTNAMLKAAHNMKRKGIDVAVGIICAPLAWQTAALLSGLEALPQSIAGELDLDSAIGRRPQLILVHDMAHQNAQGARNRKRYQDIEELLKAGIDVYTTLNLQNIESLSDAVTSITGREEENRIPDSVFDGANNVELIDIEPEDLLERLSRMPASANAAPLDPPSSEGLSTLRELAHRRLAERIGKQARRSEQASVFPREDRAQEHILTCVSGSPSNARVIRAAARIADAFHGLFTALFVEVPGPVETEAQKRLSENIKLAEQLGARIATVYGGDIATQIAEYAKTSGVSKIVIGRSSGKKRGFSRKPLLVERLIGMAANMDVYIIPESPPPASVRHSGTIQWSWEDAAKTAGFLLITSFIGLWFYSLGFSEANIVTVYILGILLTSVRTSGRLYGSISSFLSVLIFNFLFTEPRFSLYSYNPGHLVTFSVMLAASFITSSLTMRARDQAKQAAHKAYRTEVLLETSQMLQRAKNWSEIISSTAQQMVRLLGRSVFFYPVRDGTLGEPLFFPDASRSVDPGAYTGPKERTVAQWVCANNKHAGATTNTHADAKCLYLAVRSQNTVFAVTAIAMDAGAQMEAFEKNLLIAMLGECALALEKEQLSETKNRATMQAQREQLRANLLRAISHDLRTPLTSISGNAGILMSSGDMLSGEKRLELYGDIYEDALWLISLVENLLSVTRIENGTMDIHMEPELVEEVIQEALAHISRISAKRKISVALEDDLLMARMDSRLIVQVIINIVDNAIKFTPPDSHIGISAKRSGNMVCIEIADSGEGIPDEKKERLFEMFYTAASSRSDKRRGLGLGLSLCRSIVNAHGGRIYVRDNYPKGAVFCFTLPAQEVPHNE